MGAAAVGRTGRNHLGIPFNRAASETNCRLTVCRLQAGQSSGCIGEAQRLAGMGEGERTLQDAGAKGVKAAVVHERRASVCARGRGCASEITI